MANDPGNLATHSSGVQTRDLVAETEFVNPPGQDWNYGFMVRNPEFNRLELIGVTSYEGWAHYSHDVGDSDYTDRASGNLRDSGLRLSSSQNQMLLIVVGESAWLFINDQFLTRLDMGHNQDVGYVSATGGFFNDRRGSIEFLNFNVWAP